MSDFTDILAAAGHGDRAAGDRLLDQVYSELRRLAGHQLREEGPHHSLNATALVHEAYLRLLGPAGELPFQNRGHFFAAAAEAMRRILVERARKRGRLRHGGEFRRVPLGDLPAAEARDDDLLAIDEALARFAAEEPAKAELVKLRYFAGLTLDEAADALGISRATAARHWQFSRAWLYQCLSGSGPAD